MALARLLSTALGSALWAQLTFNPYSGQGWGFPHPITASAQAGMGYLGVVGLGSSLPEQPAHSAHLRGTQVDFGGYARRSHLSAQGQGAVFGTGGLQNLTLSLSNGRGWGAAFGLTPEAVLGYRSQYRLSTPTPFLAQERAQGLLSRAYAQLAARWRSIAIGYQLTYLRGTYERQLGLQLSEASLTDFLLTSLRLQGLSHSVGVLYQDSIGRFWVQLSFCYQAATQLEGQDLYRFQKSFSLSSFVVDTLAWVRGDRFRYPASYRAGVMLGKDSWMAGLEGGYRKAPDRWLWPGLRPAQGKPSWDLRAGLEWLPDPRAAVFYKRLRYQAGFYYERFPYADAYHYALTWGLGWSFPRSPSVAYLNFSYGMVPGALLYERYFSVGVALAFREQWFVQPRID